MVKKGDLYTSKDMLQADLTLMVENCRQFNGDEPDSPFLKLADQMDAFLKTLFD